MLARNAACAPSTGIYARVYRHMPEGRHLPLHGLMHRIIGLGFPIAQGRGIYRMANLFLGAPGAIAKPLLQHRDQAQNEIGARLPPIGQTDMHREPAPFGDRFVNHALSLDRGQGARHQRTPLAFGDKTQQHMMIRRFRHPARRETRLILYSAVGSLKAP